MNLSIKNVGKQYRRDFSLDLGLLLLALAVIGRMRQTNR
jgi:hypothetical protein